MRYLFIERNCPFCQQYIGIVQKINQQLDIDKRIKVVFVDNYYDYDVFSYPMIPRVLEKVKKFYNKNELSFPILILDNNIQEGISSREYAETFLETYFESLGEL